MNIRDGRTITVSVEGTLIETFFYQAGEPDRGDVLLMHTGGAGASAFMCWYLNFDALVDAGYRVTAPDAPGFGQSVVLGSGSVTAAAFVPVFLDALGK